MLAEGKTVGGNYGLNDQLQALTFIHENKEKLNYNRLTIRKASSVYESIISNKYGSLVVPLG